MSEISAINDLRLVADAIEALAFRMPAPNHYTPQFVALAITTRRLAQEAEIERRTRLGLESPQASITPESGNV